MCGPDQGAFSASQVFQWPLFYLKIGLDIGRIFAKCKICNEFFLWFTYRLSKSTYVSQFTQQKVLLGLRKGQERNGFDIGCKFASSLVLL